MQPPRKCTSSLFRRGESDGIADSLTSCNFTFIEATFDEEMDHRNLLFVFSVWIKIVLCIGINVLYSVISVVIHYHLVYQRYRDILPQRQELEDTMAPP